MLFVTKLISTKIKLNQNFDKYYNVLLKITPRKRYLKMNLFFSPPVHSYSALVPHFKACMAVEQLIETGYIQFQLNPYDDSSDPYYLIYSRIRTLKHKTTQIIATIQDKYHEPIKNLNSEEKLITVAKMKDYMKENKIDHLKYLDLQQRWVQEKVKKFQEFSQNYDHFLSMNQRINEELDTLRSKIQICQDKQLQQQFVIISGVCQNKDKLLLERLIFRKSRGHSIMVFKNRPNYQSTSVFLCFMNKNVYKHIGEKVYNACKCNNVSIYDLPNMMKNMREYENTLLKKGNQTNSLLQISGKQLTRILHDHVSGDGISLKQHLLRISYLQRTVYIICHSKQIGEPSNHVLFTIHVPANQVIPDLSVPIMPVNNKTKNRTIMPKLSCLYQANILTSLFSIPKHNQIIPSVFMFSTVPILFGMMFSDFGHGLMLMTICYAFGLGYLFYLMAFMSIYCGIIYNQFFGMKILRFQNLGVLQPIWAVSENGLNFQNSLKMKLSMIMAFTHMLFGMILKIINEKKRGQTKKIIFDSFPKIGLLLTTVGYLVFLIVVKWLTNFDGHESTAPSIINSLLELYLGWNESRNHSILGSMQTQKVFGSLLVKLNIFFILVMTFNHTIRGRMQDLFYRFSHQKSHKSRRAYNSINHQQLIQEDDQDDEVGEQISQELQERNVESYENLKNIEVNYYYESQNDHQSELGPLQVFQFVLGLISSTTSYLRLFALSLAHAKLSSLILELLLSTLSEYHPYISYIRCLAFFMITVGMMLTLDVMECLMHVVRLHWVEWMGKFYVGSGVIFKPEIEEDYE